MDDDDAKILEQLNRMPEITEADVVRTYSAIRKVAGGEPHQKQKLTIRILDAGPNFRPEFRFLCEITSDDGQVTCSNQESTPEMALGGIHWSNLDPPPPAEPRKDGAALIPDAVWRRMQERAEKRKVRAKGSSAKRAKAKKPKKKK